MTARRPTGRSGLGTPDVHVLVMISAMHDEALQAHDARLRASIERSGGLRVVYEDVGAALPGGVEHFGYADGFAQPSIEGSGVAPAPGQGAPVGQRRLAADPRRRVHPRLSRRGGRAARSRRRRSSSASTARFWSTASSTRTSPRSASGWPSRRPLYPGGEELLAAKIVGRWRDGTPVALSPAAPDPALVADEQRNNAFDYGNDGDGRRCPIGAHVRRTNPRLSLPFDGQLVNRHRIVRRGIPYGPPLAPGAPDDGQDRGVIFTCLQASIARQFEFIQSQWLNAGNTFGLGDDQDVMLGPQDGGAPEQDDRPRQPAVLPRAAVARGHGQGRRVLLRPGHQRPAVRRRGRGRRRRVRRLERDACFGGEHLVQAGVKASQLELERSRAAPRAAGSSSRIAAARIADDRSPRRSNEATRLFSIRIAIS